MDRGLGLLDRVRAELESEPRPDADRITTALWAACGADHHHVATLLVAAGADPNWIGWNNQTALDRARAADSVELAAWLEANGACSAADLS